MLEKVNFLSINSNKPKNRPAFKSNQAISYPQVNTIPSATAQYSVKTPMCYVKTAELNLPYDLKAHCYKLANGQRVVIVPKEGETVLKTYVGTGSLNEPDNVRGISHYIEHNLFNGSEGLAPDEFFKTASKMGAYTNASTNFSTTSYFIASNLLDKGDLEKELKIHASMLESPKFAPEMLEKEKGIVNSEINMYEGSVDSASISTTLKTLYGIESSSKDLIAGTTDNITKLTREDVVDYYNNNYYPANMVTVITGEVNPDEAMGLVSKYFSGSNKITHPRKFQEFNPIDKTVRKDLYSDKTKSTYIEIGFNGPRNDDAKNSVCFDLVCDILAKLNNGKSENSLKKLNTSAAVFDEKIGSRPQDPKMILCEVNTDEEKCEQVLQQLYNNIYSLINDKDYDLEALKKIRLNNRSEFFERSSGINFLIGYGMLNGDLDNVINYEGILKSITKEDISKFVSQYMDLNKAAITVTHPVKTGSKNISFTGSKNAINPDNVSRYRAANNFDILINESATNISSASLFINTHEINTAHPSAGAVLDVILQEGSSLRPGKKFEDDLLSKGINVSCGSSHNSISSFSSSASEDLNEALSSLLEVLYNPNITQENFEYAKEKVREELLLQQKSPYQKLNKEMFDGMYRGTTIAEKLADIDKLTIDDVKNHYKHILGNGQGYVIASAPFQKKPELKQNLFDKISVLPSVKQFDNTLINTYKPVENVKVLTDIDTKEQAKIVEAFKFKTTRNMKDDVTVELLNRILGNGSSSRLFNDLREKQQLAYSVKSDIGYFGDTGILSMSIGTTTDNPTMGNMKNLQKSIDGFNNHIQKLMTEFITPEELATVKLEMKNSIYSGTESTFDKNLSLAGGSATYYGPLADNEILKMIDNITPQDIYNAANYIFKNKPLYSILATENTLKANEEYLKNLEK